ncbi:hypothetical protein BGZ93_006344 [Podila epicladia]|nr:hypothetical protein BGZ92_003121 [Podila epicladia]KAG0099683.1 hypothetical protein BGZ93_006344 [Podila epicladia]
MNLTRVGRAITANEFASWVAPFLVSERAVPRPAYQQPVTPRNEEKARSSFTPCPTNPGSRSVGIAVSGGVDSMALATLLSRHVQNLRGSLQRIQLHAMIVDHKLRDNSTKEANYVAEQIRRLDIDPHILTLDWSSPALALANGNSIPDKTHLETLARLERYKAIAQQCHRLNIRQLFVGHHSGDQVETVLFRFSRASGIDGLAGIQPDAPFGVVNVQEALDLRIVRPLMNVSKARLRATCEEAATRWVEDPSNRSLDYQRNVIRHYQQDVDSRQRSERWLHPLCTASILDFRDRMDKHRKAAWSQVSPLLQGIQFDPMNGVCHLQLQAGGENVEWLHPTRSHVAIRLMSFVIRWANCKDHSPRLEDLQTLLTHLRSPHTISQNSNKVQANQGDSEDASESTAYRKTRRRASSTGPASTETANGLSHRPTTVPTAALRPINISGVMFSPPRTSKGLAGHWTISRQPMSIVDLRTNTVDISTDQLDDRSPIDLLWDQRFFLRIRASDYRAGPRRTIHIRPLTLDDARLARRTLKSLATNGDKISADQLQLFMDNVPGKTRLTIPVVSISSTSVSDSDELVSIPTLAVHLAPDLLKVQSRFKSGDPNFDILDE